MIVPRTSTPARQHQRSPSPPALRTCVLGALLLLAAGRPAAAQQGRFGFNIVRMEGVIGKGDPTRMIDVVLLVGSAEIPFAVTAVRRVSPNPEEGVGVLLALGPGTPRIRVVGEAAIGAVAGTEATATPLRTALGPATTTTHPRSTFRLS